MHYPGATLELDMAGTMVGPAQPRKSMTVLLIVPLIDLFDCAFGYRVGLVCCLRSTQCISVSVSKTKGPISYRHF
jgi:hypothetical protein